MYSSPAVRTFVSKGVLPKSVIGLANLESLFSYVSSVYYSEPVSDDLVHFFTDVLSGKLKSDYNFLYSSGFGSPIVSELFNTYFKAKRDLTSVFLIESGNVSKRCELFGDLFNYFNFYVSSLYDFLIKKFVKQGVLLDKSFSVVFDF